MFVVAPSTFASTQTQASTGATITRAHRVIGPTFRVRHGSLAWIEMAKPFTTCFAAATGDGGALAFDEPVN